MKLAILDDDLALCDSVGAIMAQSGHRVQKFRTGRDLLKSLRQNSFDLILLDCTLPDTSGADILTWVREHLDPAPPVIMITGRTGEQDIAKALTSGADDYVTKPIQEGVLKARVEAVLRRVYNSSTKKPVEIYGRYAFNLAERSLTVDDKPMAVTAKEFALALLMFRNLHRPLSRDYILEMVWGHVPQGLSRTLDAHVSQIRNRLGLRPENGLRLSSVYSFGYRLEEVDSETGESYAPKTVAAPWTPTSEPISAGVCGHP